MSQLPTTSLALPAPVHAWIDISVASQLTGHSDRHLRRLCGTDWHPQGLARLAGIKWQIRSDAHPALAPASSLTAPHAAPRLPLADARDIPPPLLKIATNRLRLLNQWQQHLQASRTLGLSSKQATARFLAGPACAADPVSERTLYIWQRGYKSAGLAGLVDGRKAKIQDTSAARTEDPFLGYIKVLYLDQKQRKIALCFDRALDKAQELGWPVCSESNVRRFIASLDPAEVILRREGEKAFTDKVEPNLIRDYSTLSSNEIWNADHHEFDVLVQVGTRVDPSTGEVTPILKRPWLTAWQDLRSRKIVGHTIRAEDPNTVAIVEAFRIGCLSHGVPCGAYTDNGKDFDSRVFTGLSKSQRRAQKKEWSFFRKRFLHVAHDQQQLGGIYAALGITHIHAWPYHGQSKPIERFFGTLEDRFGREWPTYCGRSPLHKPEDLLQQIAHGRAPTLQHFTAVFAMWLEKDYHGRIHSGDSMHCTPADAWTACLTTKRTAPADLLNLLLQPRVGPYTVTQDGFVLSGAGGGIRYAGHGELVHLLGSKVFVRLQETIATVSCWTAEDQFIAVVPAKANLPANATQAELRKAIGEKHADRKKIVASIQPRLRQHEDAADRMLRLRSSSIGLLPLDPPTLLPVRSDIEGHLNALQEMTESLPLRIAAGAESMSTRDALDAFSDITGPSVSEGPHLALSFEREAHD